MASGLGRSALADTLFFRHGAVAGTKYIISHLPAFYVISDLAHYTGEFAPA